MNLVRRLCSDKMNKVLVAVNCAAKHDEEMKSEEIFEVKIGFRVVIQLTISSFFIASPGTGELLHEWVP